MGQNHQPFMSLVSIFLVWSSINILPRVSQEGTFEAKNLEPWLDEEVYSTATLGLADRVRLRDADHTKMIRWFCAWQNHGYLRSMAGETHN